MATPDAIQSVAGADTSPASIRESQQTDDPSQALVSDGCIGEAQGNESTANKGQPIDQRPQLESERYIEGALAALDHRLNKVETKPDKPKDIFDMISAVSGILAAIIVAGFGFYVAEIYNAHSKALAQSEKERHADAIELQTVEKFLPWLSKNETDKRAAIELVSTISKGAVSRRIAGIYRGESARAALTSMAVSSSGETKAAMEAVLSQLYQDPELSGPIFYFETPERTVCTAFLASKEGRVLTAAHCLAPRATSLAQKRVPTGTPPDKEVACNRAPGFKPLIVKVARQGQEPIEASLIAKDDTHDLAILQLQDLARVGKPVEYAVIENDLVAVGFRSSPRRIAAVAARLVDYSVDRLTLDSGVSPEFSGAPLMDSKGRVFGMVASSTGTSTTGVPLQFGEELYKACSEFRQNQDPS